MVIGVRYNILLFSIIFLLSSSYKFFPKLGGIYSLSDCLLLVILLVILFMKRDKLKKFWLTWLLVVFIYLLMSLFIFNLFNTDIKGFAQVLRILLFFIVFFLTSSVFTMEDLSTKLLLSITGVFSTVRIIEFAQNYIHIKNLDDITFKSSSFLSDTNSEAIFFGSILLLFGFAKTKFSKFMSSLILISFILCNSRSLILCFVFSVFIKELIAYLISRKLNLIRLFRYFLVSTCILIVLYTLRENFLPVIERYSRIIQGEDASTEYRVNFLKTTIEIFNRSPIIGNGSGNLRMIGGEVAANVGKIDGEIFFPHNMYAYALAEFGILGLCMFLFPFLFVVFFGIKSKNYKVLSTILYICAAGFFFMDFTDRYVAFLLAVMTISVSHNLKRRKNESDAYNIASYEGRSRKRTI